MYIFIRDQEYRKRVERFINLNYADYNWLYLITDPAQLDANSATEVLTDELTFAPTNATVHYIVDADDHRPNYHYKYRSFRGLIETIKGSRATRRASPMARIVVISSLVGGCGKTTLANQMANLMAGTAPVLLVNLLAPAQSAKGMLSEHLITSQHNRAFNLADCVDQVDGIARLGGFFDNRDLLDLATDDIRQSALALFRSSGYRNVIIDAPALPHCRSIIDFGDVTYLLRDATRRSEEVAIMTGMGLGNAFKPIYVRSPEPSARTLPTNQNLRDYRLALRNILTEDGVYEY